MTASELLKCRELKKEIERMEETLRFTAERLTSTTTLLKFKPARGYLESRLENLVAKKLTLEQRFRAKKEEYETVQKELIIELTHLLRGHERKILIGRFATCLSLGETIKRLGLSRRYGIQLYRRGLWRLGLEPQDVIDSTT